MRFEPIAIVGQSCTLPGAHDPQALWRNVVGGVSCLSRVAPGRWGLPASQVMGTVAQWQDRSWSDVGGYVTGFDARFDPTGFRVPADEVRGLDPVFQVTLHGVREALRSAGLDGATDGAGLVLGNLSFPSAGLARFAQAVWFDEASRPDARNRFTSGLPALLAAKALGLGRGGFALDAACASSLYAIKLACDRLHDRAADVMVAGAVNQADDLFIHVGFCALSAMSKTGQSRPFHRGADGLVPAEGAGFVVLQRLSDALAQGRHVLGVIRGVGLSNDGRGRGLLAPSEEGQERALRLAYEMSGLSPSEVGLVECHATGTPVGDATELRSMARVFAGCRDVPIGSLKSNLGHLITAAGVAGLLKVLAAMEEGVRPPTLHVDAPNEALEGSPFRLLTKAEPWVGPRRAGVSAFGFGGNNAHLIVERLEETRASGRLAVARPPAGRVAIVGVGARVGGGDSAADLTRAVLTGVEDRAPREKVSVALEGLRFPPNDLAQALGQQTMVLEAAREAARTVALPRERTAVLVGMGCDAEVARYGARWRLAQEGVDAAALAQARDGVVPVLQAPGVLGTMPNIPANRINGQLDVAGPAFTVSSEEASGLTALELAVRALRAGEVDAALVGAVDLSHEPVHQAALAALGRAVPSGDGAVVLALKRLEDAQRDGDTVFATVADAATDGVEDAQRLGDVSSGVDLTAILGRAHAAHGLVHVAAGALALRHGARLHAGREATPAIGAARVSVEVSVLEAPPARVALEAVAVAPWSAEAARRLHVFSGADARGALSALDSGHQSDAGPARLVVVAADQVELAERAKHARRWLETGGPPPEGVAFRERPIGGEVAFVFTGAAAAYPGMGREVSLALPAQVAAVAQRCEELPAVTRWLFGPGSGQPEHPLDQLWGASFVCQLHAEVTRGLLGLRPTAAIGYSSGESNSLFAMGAWTDLGAMMRESRTGPLFNEALCGPFTALDAVWTRRGVTGSRWASYALRAPVEKVCAALAGEPLAHLTIVNAADDCVIGGEAAACERVVAAVGRSRAMPLGYDLAAHAPELEEVRDAWWRLHLRPVQHVPGVRFYTNATNASYVVADSTQPADAITGQALRTLDFPKTIERAWADGVRVFIEHGPRGLCAGWIRRTLGERAHLAVSLDVQGRSGVRQLLNATAWLVAGGVRVDARALEAALAQGAVTMEAPRAKLEVAAHQPPVRKPGARVGATAAAVSVTPMLAAGASGEPFGRSAATPSMMNVGGTAGVGTTAVVQSAGSGSAGAVDPTGRSAPTPSAVHDGASARVRGTSAAQAPAGAQRSGGDARTSATMTVGQAATSALRTTGVAMASAAEGAQFMEPAPELEPVLRGAVPRAVAARAAVPAPAVPASPPPSVQSAPLAQRGSPARPAAFPAPSRHPARPSFFGSPPPSTRVPFFPAHGAAAASPTHSRRVSGSLAPALPSPAPGALVMNDSLQRLAAQQAHLAEVHRRFLDQQAAVHEEFLATQRAAEAALLNAWSAVTRGASMPVPAMPAASAPVVEAAPVVMTPPAPVVAPLAPRAPVTTAPPAAVATAPTHATPEVLPGPKFSRAQLEVLASGSISSVFGAQFEGQDGFARQVRMPEPPLLLADRVTGIDAVPGSMGKGTIWTETDVTADSWYLDGEGRMPAGVMIESGQADLLLISWLGIDALNQGERVYRLLGCDLTYHGGLPVPGDTLQYDIHVDGHAKQGDVRLFFFHYDCRIRGETRLTVRNGQAGFFTDEELANSAGVLWDPEVERPEPAQVDPPAVQGTRARLTPEQLRAFAAGRPFDCFGPGWELTRTHVRTPRITDEKMQFLHEVTAIDHAGGPWGRGYLRAETPVTPDDWFFKGHFKNDPCMPGTLMFEGCLQAMSVYLASLGFTIERDAWRFEPVPGNRIPMRCRGQVTPQSKHLVYEVFVSEVSAGPIPTVYADLLCTVDGRKAFHAKRVGLRLSPDWPMTYWKSLGPAQTQATGALVPLPQLSGLVGYQEPKPVAVVDGFPFDYHSLLACAWGPPSQAFGPFYARFDGTRRAARLPGPPYHFMSRITKLDGPIGGMQPGTSVEVEYDVPVEQWYFEENGHSTMPFCVLMEAALQPCGWLASYVGSALTTDVDLLFRNLDGTGTQLVEVLPTSGTFTTKVKLLSISQSAGMIIENFDVTCSIGGVPVFTMKTVFGFFPKEAFENQVGLPVSPEERARFTAPGAVVADLTTRPAKYCGGAPRLAGDMLRMIDRVIESSPTGGSKGLGYLRAEKTVDVDEWFFKAHFFQDPVQPGSLGVEALLQLLQFHMLERGLADGIENPRFEPIRLGKPVTWKYRGQVVPKNKVIGSEVQIVEVGRDERGVYAVAEGWLWVDGKRIYATKDMGMRIVPGPPPVKAAPTRAEDEVEVLDPAKDTWLLDHCPTWTMPALPMMSMVDRLVAAAERQAGRVMGELRDVQVHRWLPFPGGPVRLKTEVTGEGDERAVTLLAWREAQDPALSRFEPVASGRVCFTSPGTAPAPFAPCEDAVPEVDPYTSGALFHGKAFQHLTAVAFGSAGSTATLDAAKGAVPRGALHQGLLDAATHAIPHDWLSRWSPQVPGDHVAYPYRLKSLRRFAPLPDYGTLRLETRFAGFDGEPRFPMVDVQVLDGARVLLDFRLVEVLLPRGPIGAAPRDARRAFLKGRAFVPGVGLSVAQGDATRLTASTLRQSDWLPGNMAALYGVPAERRGDLLAEVAVRDHVARRAFVHPSTVTFDGQGARAAVRPLRRHPLSVERAGDQVLVRDAAPPEQDLSAVKAWWRERFQVGEWPVEDLYYGLARRFVGDVVLADPPAFSRAQGRSCLYVANHQVGVESLLFSVLISALSRTPTVTLAKAEHRTSWLGTLIAHNFSYPGVVDPRVITFFDRDDKESLLRIVGELGAEMQQVGKSVMVHVEGTRSLACGAPVEKMSSAFLDLALAVGAPIVPVRFVGALPREPLVQRLEFPLGLGRQDYWVGRPILPEELQALPLKERKAAVLAAMNALGPALADEQPFPGDAQLVADVEAWRSRTGCSEEDAVLFVTLATQTGLGAEAQRLVDGARAWRLSLDGDARSQWLGGLARRFFGPRGPTVVGPA
jgi:acyl transferase domain-containing protein/3-hydroxymyristoyl/3-hydroxydecanoyl-(acyl carrier protein) dehydratase/1-acyl-sn-glycerol-3-phosphate acyltransferase